MWVGQTEAAFEAEDMRLGLEIIALVKVARSVRWFGLTVEA